MREVPWTVVRGFLMGSADVVPGVSGGTIALVLGIYERLIDSIRHGAAGLGSAVRLDLHRAIRSLRLVEWSFILPLIAGILLAIASLAGILEDLLERRPVEVAAFFLGLVTGSVVVTWQMVRRWDRSTLVIMGITAVTVFAALGIRAATETSADQLRDVAEPAFFAAGAIAVCAMILPGISGSFILVLLGMYGPVLGAVNDRDVLSVALVAAGAVVGLALFSQVLHWALSRHHDAVMAALIGLMAGSLRVLWPWPDGVGSTALEAPDESLLAATLLAALGFAVVVVIHRVAVRMEGRSLVART